MSSLINPQNNWDLNQGILHLWSKFGGPSLNGWWVIAWTSSKWGKFWLFEDKFDLEGKGQSPLKTIGNLNKVFYTCVSNLVILAWTGLELSCGQASDWHTDWHTDAGNDNTQEPKLASGKNLTLTCLSKRILHHFSPTGSASVIW